MSRSTRVLPRLAALAILTLATAAAHADPVEQLGQDMGWWVDRLNTLRDRGQFNGIETQTPEKCVARLDEAIAAGMSGSQDIVSSEFKTHPRARPHGTSEFAITIDDARDYCAAYAPLHRFFVGRKPFDDVAARHGAYREGVRLSTETADELRRAVAACRAAWKALHAAGVPDDLPVLRIDGVATFGELKTALCDDHDKELTTAAAATTAGDAAVREKWTAAGARGEQLALLVKYDGLGWRLPGGAVTEDPARIAKARTLFQWLVAADPDDDRYELHTIRRYRFKAGRYTVGEKQYRRRRGQSPGNVFK